jgi:uncharacterized protein
VEFEWDEDKRQRGIAKHQVDLLYAAGVFEGPVMIAPDDRAAYGEERLVAIGMVRGEVFVVVFTHRGGKVRLISARKGGRRDRRKYQTRLA